MTYNIMVYDNISEYTGTQQKLNFLGNENKPEFNQENVCKTISTVSNSSNISNWNDQRSYTLTAYSLPVLIFL